MDNYDDRIKNIALKLRNIRELKDLTRSEFYESLGENSEYWGRIERGEQPISLQKILLICDIYNIPIETLVDIHFQELDDKELKQETYDLIEKCNYSQLEIIKKFIEEFVLKM